MKSARNTRYSIHAITMTVLILLGAVLLWTCQNPLDIRNEDDPTGSTSQHTTGTPLERASLVLSIQSVDGETSHRGLHDISVHKPTFRTIFPTYPSGFAEYVLTFSNGPAVHDPVTITTSTTTVELEIGTWTIGVEAKETVGGPVVASGSKDVTVVTGGSSDTITIGPTTSGTGSLDITLDWPDTTSVSTVDAVFHTIGSTVESAVFEPDPPTTSDASLTGSYPSGDYKLIARLKDGSGNLLATVADVVKIYDNITTSHVFSLSDGDIRSAPSAPTSLTATAVSSSEILLTWSDTSANEEGFVVERKVGAGGSYSQIASLDFATISYSDDNGGAGLTPGTTYFYRVRAVNTFGDSSYSAEQSATTLGSLGLTITFTEPTDETITLDQTSDQSFAPSDTFSVTIQETFNAYLWSLDGNAGSIPDTDNSVIIDCSTLTEAGVHVLTCFLRKDTPAPSRWYAKTLFFYVENIVSTISPKPTPTDGATLTDATPLLDWTDVTGAEGYRLQINTASDFSGTMEVDDDTLTLSQYQVAAGLTEGQLYYWRIKAKSDNAQWTNWSSTWSFTVSFLTSSDFSLTEVIAIGDTGTFDMGSTSGDSDEQPVHSVTLTRSYSIGTYEVTNSQAAAVFNYALDQGWITASTSTVQNLSGDAQELLDLDSGYCQISYSADDLIVDSGFENYPCVDITWYGSVGFCYYLNEIEGKEQTYSLSDWSCDFSKSGYRLPTEAEWEYAARGGNQSLGYIYAGSDTVDDVAWYSDNSGQTPNSNFDSGQGTHEVGTKQSNEIGTYDMSGNVWEWCNDWYDSGYYSISPLSDPEGPSSGSYHVQRSGGWRYEPHGSRVVNRTGYLADGGRNIGFRPVLQNGVGQ